MLQNAAPIVYQKAASRHFTPEEYDDNIKDELDAREIFDLIRDIKDPEHPLTLEELNIVSEENIEVVGNHVVVRFTATIPHCSMATVIGLAIRVKLLRTLAACYKTNILVFPGSHVSEFAINKQLQDKERIAAALENPDLLKVVNHCLITD